MWGVLPGLMATRANGFLAVMPPVVARSIITPLYPPPANLILKALRKVRSLAEHGLQSGAIIHSAFAGCQPGFHQSVELRSHVTASSLYRRSKFSNADALRRAGKALDVIAEVVVPIYQIRPGPAHVHHCNVVPIATVHFFRNFREKLDHVPLQFRSRLFYRQYPARFVFHSYASSAALT